MGVEYSLKQLSDGSTDSIESIAIIHLLFTFQRQLDGKFNPAWKYQSTRILYVALLAFVEEYAALKDEDPSELL